MTIPESPNISPILPRRGCYGPTLSGRANPRVTQRRLESQMRTLEEAVADARARALAKEIEEIKREIEAEIDNLYQAARDRVLAEHYYERLLNGENETTFRQSELISSGETPITGSKLFIKNRAAKCAAYSLAMIRTAEWTKTKNG